MKRSAPYTPIHAEVIESLGDCGRLFYFDVIHGLWSRGGSVYPALSGCIRRYQSYRKFIQSYAILVGALTQMLRALVHTF